MKNRQRGTDIRSLGFLAAISLFSISFSYPSYSENNEFKNYFLYGYCLHLGFEKSAAYNSPPDVAAKLSYLGANSTRDDLLWGIRKAQSQHTLPQSMSKIAYGLNNINARPLLILTGNTKDIPEGQPASDESRKTYAAYAKDAAIALKGANPIFEIWNEWNIASRKDKNLGTPENYIALAKETYPAIKQIMPNGIVLAGAVARNISTEPDTEWILKAVNLGLMNYADGLSIHIYDRCMKRADKTGVEIIEQLRDIHNKLQEISPNKEIPIYVTELGWPNEPEVCGGNGESITADGIAQILLTAPTLPWLKGIWFYELLDQGEDPKNREHFYGLYRFNGELKPAGCAARTVWNFISETTSAEFSNPQPHISMITFKSKSGNKRIALWETDAQVWKRDPLPMAKWVYVPDSAKGTPLCNSAQPQAGSWSRIKRTPLLMELPENAVAQIQFK